MGFSTPPLRFYNMNLYPLTQGGSIINASQRNNFNRNTSFYTANTEFSQPFGVNVVPTDRRGDNFYYTFNQNGSLNQKSLNSLNPTNRNFALSDNGNIQQVNTPAVAPTSPTTYNDYLKALAISDFNFADLKNQPSFQLSNIGIGLEVTTDGAGNIDNVHLDPAIQAIAEQSGALDPTFGFLNRREALLGAIQNLSPAADIVLENTGQQPLALQPQTQAGNVNPFRQLDPNKSDRLAQPVGNQNNPFGTNNVLNRLKALQPQTEGVKLTGRQAEVTPFDPQTVATARAGFDVRISPEVQNQIALTTQKNQIQSQSQAHLNHQMIAKGVDGTIPMAPTLPVTPDGRSNEVMTSLASQNGLGMEGIEIGSDKKGSGGYIPFQQSGTSTQTGTETGSFGESQQQQQQFTGQNEQQSDEQQKRQFYKPLTLMA